MNGRMKNVFWCFVLLLAGPVAAQSVVGIVFSPVSSTSFQMVDHQAQPRSGAVTVPSGDPPLQAESGDNPVSSVMLEFVSEFSERDALGPSPASVSESSCDRSLPPPRRSLAVSIDRRRDLFWPLIRDAECRHGIPMGLLDSLVIQESRYQPSATSPVGASGLAQLMPGTARSLGVRDRYDPVSNVDGGARYLRQMLDRFGSVELALAAYNAGPGAVERYRGIPRYRETQGYVRRVLTFWDEIAFHVPVASRMAQRLGFIDTFTVPIP